MEDLYSKWLDLEILRVRGEMPQARLKDDKMLFEAEARILESLKEAYLQIKSYESSPELPVKVEWLNFSSHQEFMTFVNSDCKVTMGMIWKPN